MKTRNRSRYLLLFTINWNIFVLNFVLQDDSDVAKYCHF